MKFKEFKQVVLNYFYKNSMLKKKYVKKNLSFKYIPNDLENVVLFKFAEEVMQLKYCRGVWMLFNLNKPICYNVASTIEMCCDFLFKEGIKC